MFKIFKDRRTLSLQLRDRIRAMIREDNYRTGDKLPTEDQLSAAFGVSRASVREALKLLEEEKLIVVRHGLGRFVALEATTMLHGDVTRLESVTEMAHNLGIEIETEVISFKSLPAGDIPWAHLDLEDGSSVYALERVRKTAGEPVIFSIDVFPTAIAPGSIELEALSGSLLSIMENDWGERLSYARTTIGAEKLDPALCRRIGSDAEQIWILLEQSNYNERNRPVLYSRDYHRSDKFRFHVLRRRR